MAIRNRPWAPTDKSKLRNLAGQNTSTGKIAFNLHRTKAAIYKEASRLHIPLAPYGPSRKH
jgi:IS30 family transposase